jgi:DNA-binding transcriptional MerR regulator
MDFQIPEKLYYKIGEVAKFTGVKTHVLRYWETEFKVIRPNKSRSNQRLYRKQDVELILRLKDLLYNQGFTIAGARKKLREKPTEKNAEVAVEASAAPSQAKTQKKVSVEAEATDQLALPLSGAYDPKLLKEIREDLLRLKKSLEANP